MADTFDTTLARLEESFAAHHRFATTRAILQVASADPSKDELAELVPMLVETNERNIQVVDDLLRLAAAEQVAYDPDPVELADLVEEAVRERDAGAVRVEAHAEVDGEVRGNAALLRQLVINLVDNGIRHNVPGGSVELTVSQIDDEVVLEVDNSGPIVDPDVVDRLFEPFYRAEPRVGSDRGHGLGLTLVRAVAGAHGGNVIAKAKPTGGLAVRVALPAADVR